MTLKLNKLYISKDIKISLWNIYPIIGCYIQVTGRILKIQQPENKQLSFKKWTDYCNRYFIAEAMVMENKHTKRCCKSCVIENCKFKRTDQYITIKIVISQTTVNTKFWWECGTTKSVIYYWWECKMVEPLGKKLDSFLMKLNISYSYDLAFELGKRMSDIYPFKNSSKSLAQYQNISQ